MPDRWPSSARQTPGPGCSAGRLFASSSVASPEPANAFALNFIGCWQQSFPVHTASGWSQSREWCHGVVATAHKPFTQVRRRGTKFAVALECRLFFTRPRSQKHKYRPTHWIQGRVTSFKLNPTTPLTLSIFTCNCGICGKSGQTVTRLDSLFIN